MMLTGSRHSASLCGTSKSVLTRPAARVCHGFSAPSPAASCTSSSCPDRPTADRACRRGSGAWHRRPLTTVAAEAAPGHGPPEQANLPSKARIAVFVSGGGSNFKAIHAACLDGRIHGEIVAVVSDVPTCGGVEHARLHGIATLTYPVPKKGGFPGLTVDELVAALTVEHKADLVLLAGYLKLVPVEVVRCFKRAMLNIHPALLPSFGGKGYYGERVHKAVIASGARFSGPTIHFVDEEFDTGPILAQRVVPVLPTDSYKQLAARVLKEEHLVYPEAVAAVCSGRVTWRDDGVPILWSAH